MIICGLKVFHYLKDSYYIFLISLSDKQPLIVGKVLSFVKPYLKPYLKPYMKPYLKP